MASFTVVPHPLNYDLLCLQELSNRGLPTSGSKFRPWARRSELARRLRSTIAAEGGWELAWRLGSIGHATTSVHFTPDGKALQVLLEDARVSIRKPTNNSREVVHSLIEFAAACCRDGCAFAPGSDIDVRFRETLSGAEQQHLEQAAKAGTIKLAPNGQVLLSAVGESAIVWDVSSWKVLQTLRHPLNIACVALSDDTTKVACGAGSGSATNAKFVTIWAANSGAVCHRLPLPSRPCAVSFSPGGCLLAAVAADGSVAVEGSGVVVASGGGAYAATLVGKTVGFTNLQGHGSISEYVCSDALQGT